VGHDRLDDNLSLCYSGVSARSGISCAGTIEIEECFKTDTVSYNYNNHYVLIPINANASQLAVVKLQWEYELPLHTLNALLKAV
jgi:hypothetical protein